MTVTVDTVTVDTVAGRATARRELLRSRTAVVALLDVVPALRNAVPSEDRALAHRVLTATTRTLDLGGLTALPGSGRDRPFAALVVRGALMRETHLGDRGVGELLGPGDLVDIHADDESDLCSLPSRVSYTVHQPATLAFLDDRFRAAARRWPALHEVLGAQRTRQARRASKHLAALTLPRVDERIVALFCDLADRWGHVTPNGITIDLPLTHATIGQLVGARRPTVTLALADLAADGRLTRRADHTWVLTGLVGTA